MTTVSRRETWRHDQLTKSLFFRQKLYLWGLIQVAEEIESVEGENLDWDFGALGISAVAWNKIIHNGIKPVIVFAHPSVLMKIQRSVSYYRMLAMVSQKSMGQVGTPTKRFESSAIFPSLVASVLIARRLNTIVSHLIEADDHLNRREFDLWRGMAAGSQAQGSWQNTKGKRAETVIRNHLVSRLRASGLMTEEIPVDRITGALEVSLLDGRQLRMGAEPDLAIHKRNQIEVAVEIKGGIDVAGVLERVGAAIKSLRRAKEENPDATTILIVQGVSMSEQAVRDIQANSDSVNEWFILEDILSKTSVADKYYQLLGI